MFQVGCELTNGTFIYGVLYGARWAERVARKGRAIGGAQAGPPAARQILGPSRLSWRPVARTPCSVLSLLWGRHFVCQMRRQRRFPVYSAFVVLLLHYRLLDGLTTWLLCRLRRHIEWCRNHVPCRLLLLLLLLLLFCFWFCSVLLYTSRYSIHNIVDLFIDLTALHEHERF